MSRIEVKRANRDKVVQGVLSDAATHAQPPESDVYPRLHRLHVKRLDGQKDDRGTVVDLTPERVLELGTPQALWDELAPVFEAEPGQWRIFAEMDEGKRDEQGRRVGARLSALVRSYEQGDGDDDDNGAPSPINRATGRVLETQADHLGRLTERATAAASAQLDARLTEHRAAWAEVAKIREGTWDDLLELNLQLVKTSYEREWFKAQAEEQASFWNTPAGSAIAGAIAPALVQRAPELLDLGFGVLVALVSRFGSPRQPPAPASDPKLAARLDELERTVRTQQQEHSAALTAILERLPDPGVSGGDQKKSARKGK